MIYFALIGWSLALVILVVSMRKQSALRRQWNEGLLNLGCAWRYHTGEVTADIGQSEVPEARMYHKLAMRFYE